MTVLEDARVLDAEGDAVEAARAYEMAIRNNRGDRESLVDLAVLYFTLLDPGEGGARALDQSFLDQAWERANDLLREASERYGPDSEIRFWCRYFAFIVLGEDSFVEECRSLANQEESLVPYLYLWPESGECGYRKEAKALHAQVAAGRTARERYIRSVVEKAVL